MISTTDSKFQSLVQALTESAVNRWLNGGKEEWERRRSKEVAADENAGSNVR